MPADIRGGGTQGVLGGEVSAPPTTPANDHTDWGLEYSAGRHDWDWARFRGSGETFKAWPTVGYLLLLLSNWYGRGNLTEIA